MSDKPLPDWIEIGKTVVVCTRGRRVYRTVVRLTKTRIVLDNGDWYRRDDLRSPTRSAWSIGDHLEDPQDSKVVAEMARQRVFTVYERLALAMSQMPIEYRRTGQDYIKVAVLAARLAEVAEYAAATYSTEASDAE